FRPEPGVEGVEARFGPIRAAEPDRPAVVQIADHEAVPVPRRDGYLVDADDPRRRRSGGGELVGHVLFVEFLDRVPVEGEFLGDLRYRRRPAPATDVSGEPRRAERITREPVEA